MMRSWFENILTSKGVVTVWLGYVLIAALIQYFLSHTLYTDDAMGSLLLQDFRIGYTIRNPPLWEWVLWTIQQWIGPGFESHWLLRYACVALLGIAAFDASRAVSQDLKWSATVTLGLPLFYAIGWGYFMRNTYSLAVVIVCLFTLSVAIRYVARPDYPKAALFGILIGLGFLSKYNYAIFVISLLLALLLQRGSRMAVARKEFVLVPVAAFITISPFFLWLLSVDADLVGLTEGNLVTSESSHFTRVVEGIGRELEIAVAFLLPWIAIAAAAAWRGRYLAEAPMRPPGFEERLAGLTLLIAVSVTTLGIVLLGVTKLNTAYLYPVLITAVPYSAAWLSRAAPGTEGAMPVALIGISALGVVLLLRFAYLSNSGFPEHSQRRDMWPIAELATEMRKAGLDQGTLVTVSYREGGNLRAELPELRVVTLGQSDETRPSRSADHAIACRLLWNDTASLFPDSEWARSEAGKVAALFPETEAAGIDYQFDVPWPPTYFGTPRVSRWNIIELEADDPLCR